MDGVDGPVRGHVKGTIEPLGEGERSRLTMSLDFESHGIGKLLVPLVVRPRVRMRRAPGRSIPGALRMPW